MRQLTVLLATALTVAACTSIDCPVENVVATGCKLVKPDGSQDTLRYDTLTITTRDAAGNDTVLLNRSTATMTFSLPVSSGAAADTLTLQLTDTLGNTRSNTLIVAKTDRPHFESVDCAMSHFHTITGVKWTGSDIDSVVINKNNVDYDSSTPHLLIYLHPDR